MNERELLATLLPKLPTNASTIVGPGDDCAVIDLGLPDRWFLLKTDAVVEGVHFTPETAPRQIGRKALARALSDIAAMAGTPTHALVTIGISPHSSADRIDRLYSGLIDLASAHQVAISGGETTASPGGLFVSVTLLGFVSPKHCLRRSGARPGDALFVTGELGGSIRGKHIEFEPRLAESRWLAQSFPISAMIDLSDGLASDLRHILKASGTGAELHSASIPISRAARQQAAAESSAKPPLLAALTDGEDYELLFTLPSRFAVSLLDAWKAHHPHLRLTCIGKITAGDRLLIRDKQGLRPLSIHGYTHLA